LERLTFDGLSGSDPLDWLGHLSDDKTHCIAVNDLDAWGSGLAETCAAEFVPALADHLERNWLVLDWYGFISASEWTPFGLHSDSEPSLLFNLGPGTKTAWVWAPDMLPNLSRGRPTTLHFDELLEDAVAYSLSPGAAIAIPQRHFHVLKSDAPCTLFGAGLYPVDYTNELSAFISSKAPRGTRDVGGDITNPSALLAKFVAAVGRQPSSGDEFNRYLRLLRARTRSLSYSRTPRVKLRRTGGTNVDAQHFRITQHPIIVVAECAIVVNGATVEVPTRSVDAAALRDWLSQHSQFRGDDFIAAFTPSESEQARQIVQQLFQHDILRVGRSYIVP
jgi:hypothetical protein